MVPATLLSFSFLVLKTAQSLSDTHLKSRVAHANDQDFLAPILALVQIMGAVSRHEIQPRDVRDVFRDTARGHENSTCVQRLRAITADGDLEDATISARFCNLRDARGKVNVRHEVQPRGVLLEVFNHDLARREEIEVEFGKDQAFVVGEQRVPVHWKKKRLRRSGTSEIRVSTSIILLKIRGLSTTDRKCDAHGSQHGADLLLWVRDNDTHAGMHIDMEVHHSVTKRTAETLFSFQRCFS